MPPDAVIANGEIYQKVSPLRGHSPGCVREKNGSNLSTPLKQICLASKSGVTSRMDSLINGVDLVGSKLYKSSKSSSKFLLSILNVKKSSKSNSGFKIVTSNDLDIESSFPKGTLNIIRSGTGSLFSISLVLKSISLSSVERVSKCSQKGKSISTFSSPKTSSLGEGGVSTRDGDQNPEGATDQYGTVEKLSKSNSRFEIVTSNDLDIESSFPKGTLKIIGSGTGSLFSISLGLKSISLSSVERVSKCSQNEHVINDDDDAPPREQKEGDTLVDQVMDEHTVIQDDKIPNDVTSDYSKPPGFKNYFKKNNECSHSSITSRARKCSTSFTNYSRKELKGFSFIDEMNRMIEVGGALGYDVKGGKKSLRQMINSIDLPMGGRKFTWVNKVGSKMSKLDRFLISNDTLQSFRITDVVALDKIMECLEINIDAKNLDNLRSWNRWTWFRNQELNGRQILDGPLILSEIIDWYKKRKKKLMLFKVDFKKAFDSMSWRYLDFVLDKLGFGTKWRSWIKVGLVSARTSILVNGGPTSEFSLKRGLRQGDPLSPFLFIIVMEGLHMTLRDGVAANMFQGVKVGSPGILLSHLFYADDVVIFSEWNQTDMENIIRILNIFYIASGLKINIHKSNVYGIGMLIDQFKARLSGWKANLLSVGGRLTLIKSVQGGSDDSRKLAWVKWSNILASLDKGGLGIGSLKAFNLSLLLKWRWRSFQNPDVL
ncbi:RNA-directed DNA polymerase, eukaryota, reverse transcriptase zinc-binding domain protein [Tanacetum coccineum]